MYNNYYTTPTFKVNVEKEIESIIDKVMIEYDCFSTNELKNILFEKFELQDLRGYKSLTRTKWESNKILFLFSINFTNDNCQPL